MALERLTVENWNASNAKHLLERTGFGSTPEEIHQFSQLSLKDAVNNDSLGLDIHQQLLLALALFSFGLALTILSMAFWVPAWWLLFAAPLALGAVALGAVRPEDRTSYEDSGGGQ